MNHPYKIIAALLLASGTYSAANASDTDTLFCLPDTLGSNYTLILNDAQLKNETDSFTVFIRHERGTRNWAAAIKFQAGQIKANNEVIVRNLKDGMQPHNYRFVHNYKGLYIYRNNILMASTSEIWRNIPYETSKQNLPAEFTLIGCDAMAEGMKLKVEDKLQAIEPQPIDYEDKTEQMLGSTKNLIKDPFMNTPFVLDNAQAPDRSYTSNIGTIGGWGSEAEMSSDSYSGPLCVKISGQAYNNGMASTGASLEIPVSLSMNMTYLVRAMVRSYGYIGRISVGESSYITINDTQGEWQQIEGLLTPSATTSYITINNADYENDGTLYIDNIEVYATSNLHDRVDVIPYATLPANTLSRYPYDTDTQIHMLGFTLDGERSSQLDPSNIRFDGAVSLTQTVKGSVLYPIYFPGTLQSMDITGTYDGKTWKNLVAVNGLDYLVYRYNAPYFELCPTDEPIPAGSYLIQFVENLEDAQIRMITYTKKKDQNTSGNGLRLIGNDTYTLYTPNGKFLKFNAEEGKFILTENEALAPFEAYLTTDESVPVKEVYPYLTATGLKQISTETGNRISVYSVEGGIMIHASAPENVSIYHNNGAILKEVSLNEGANFQPLAPGFYLVGNQKIGVVR